MGRSPLIHGLRCAVARFAQWLLLATLGACSAPPSAPPPLPKEEAATIEARTKAKRAAELLHDKDSDGALTLALEALETSRKVLGESSPVTESVLELLGDIYFARGQLDVAEQVLTRSLAIRTLLVGADDPALAEVLERLYVVHERRGQLDRAREVLTRSIALRKAVPGPPSYALATAQLNLGALHLQQCRIEEAAPLLTQALAAAEATLPVGSPLFARFLDALGDLQRFRGQTAEALPLFAREERLLALRDARDAERMLGLLRRVLAIHEDRGDLEQSSAVIARALVLVERWLPARSPAVLELSLPLAALFNAADNRPKAVLLYQRFHLVEHTFPPPAKGASTRLESPRFTAGFEPGSTAGPKRNACVPAGKEAEDEPSRRLLALRSKLAACHAVLPPGAPRAPADARVTIELDPKGAVKHLGAVTFDDVPAALVDCALPQIAALHFDPPIEGAERRVFPLHLDLAP